MASAPRLLFVDDEPAIRTTLSTILRQHGFEVATASNVAEALSLITARRFDVLISDLNIGEPGDGFTVVSAMRRVQPESVTMILTGYPAFESALRAIREQVDDFLTKPAQIDELVACIERKLGRPKLRSTLLTKRVPQIIMEHKSAILEQWYAKVEALPDIAAIPLSPQERLSSMNDVLDELISGRKDSHEAVVSHHALDSSAMHGVMRREQGYSIPMLLEESHALYGVLSETIRQNLLEIEISYLIGDLINIGDLLHRLTEESVRAYLRHDITSPAA